MRMPRHLTFFPRLAILTSASLLCFFTEQSSGGPYLDSAHGGGSGNGVWRSSVGSYATGNCAHCHEQHASIGEVEPDPVKPGPSNFMLFSDMEGNAMCNYCHNGSIPSPVDDIASQISKTHSHDPNSAKGPPYDPNTSKGPVLCNDCHDSHVAKATNHIEGQGNAVSGPLLSVAGVSVSSWPLPGNPPPGSDANLLPSSPTLNDINPITMEYQLCFKCHGGQADYLSRGLVDLPRQFNPNNFSVHPVATNTFTWKNNHLISSPSALKTPWDTSTNAQMYCSDCHGSDNSADPVGPHGSSNFFMLKYYGPGITIDNLCNKCHDVLASSAWVEGAGNPDPLLNGDHTLGEHQYPFNSMGCLACHGGINGALTSNVHGANYLWADYLGNPGRPSKEFLVGGLITQNYYIGTDTRGNRHCASSCHTKDGGAGYTY